MEINTHAWLILLEYRAISMICLLGGFFGEIKPLFTFTQRETVLLPMSEIELRCFW